MMIGDQKNASTEGEVNYEGGFELAAAYKSPEFTVEITLTPYAFAVDYYEGFRCLTLWFRSRQIRNCDNRPKLKVVGRNGCFTPI